MPQYQTRHLISQVERVHEGRALTVGEEFDATEHDAAYYVQNGWARPADHATKMALGKEVKHQQAQAEAQRQGDETGAEVSKPKTAAAKKTPGRRGPAKKAA